MAVLRLLWPALNTWNQVLATGHTQEGFRDVSSGITVLSSERMNKGIILGPKRSLLSFRVFITSFHIPLPHILSVSLVTTLSFLDIVPSPLFITTGKLLSR